MGDREHDEKIEADWAVAGSRENLQKQLEEAQAHLEETHKELATSVEYLEETKAWLEEAQACNRRQSDHADKAERRAEDAEAGLDDVEAELHRDCVEDDIRIQDAVRELRQRAEKAEARIKELEAQLKGDVRPLTAKCTCGDTVEWNEKEGGYYCIGCDKVVEPERPMRGTDYASKAEVRRLAYIMTHLCRARGPYLDGSDPNKGLWRELRKLAEDDPPTRDVVEQLKGVGR